MHMDEKYVQSSCLLSSWLLSFFPLPLLFWLFSLSNVCFHVHHLTNGILDPCGLLCDRLGGDSGALLLAGLAMEGLLDCWWLLVLVVLVGGALLWPLVTAAAAWLLFPFWWWAWCFCPQIVIGRSSSIVVSFFSPSLFRGRPSYYHVWHGRRKVHQR